MQRQTSDGLHNI